MPGKGNLQLTGKLGEVIRESAQIGLSWVKSHAYELGITKDPAEQWLNALDMHVHMPEGSIGKEGPSAGTAILSAIVSLLTKTNINPDIGMYQTSSFSLVVSPENGFISNDWRDIPRWTGSASGWIEGENSRGTSRWHQNYYCTGCESCGH
jgi:Lon protease (S16) C-terminal proteolytic domain